MKKIFFALLFTFILNFSYIFGYYSSSTLIDFLVHENQVRGRTDRLGVLFGSDSIRAVVGLTSADTLSGVLFNNFNNSVEPGEASFIFTPSVLGAIGYKSDAFGIGVGYEYTYKMQAYSVHTPAITMTALDDAFRVNIPVSIGVGANANIKDVKTELDGTMVISAAPEFRYYFGNKISWLDSLRFYVNYGHAHIENVLNKEEYLDQSSFGAQLRIYFKVDTPNVLVEPILRLQFDKAFRSKYDPNVFEVQNVSDNFNITAKGFSPHVTFYGAGLPSGAQGNPNLGSLRGGYIASIPSPFYAEEPYRIGVAIPVGFTALNADKSIEFYLEPSLSYTFIDAADSIFFNSIKDIERKDPFHAVAYVLYGELYFRPVEQLEFYLEIQAGGSSVATESIKAGTSAVLNANTGFSWYF